MVHIYIFNNSLLHHRDEMLELPLETDEVTVVLDRLGDRGSICSTRHHILLGTLGCLLAQQRRGRGEPSHRRRSVE